MKLRVNKFLLCCVLSAFLFPLASGVMADDADAIPPFELGSIGCPMAHCDPQMSDNPGLPVPGKVDYENHEFPNLPSAAGLGCVSNGAMAACTFASDLGALRAFDRDGKMKWRSGSFPHLNASSWTSAPLIDKNGFVIAADNQYIWRFNDYGYPVWKALIPGGTPISPVSNGRDLILVGTKGGPVSTFLPTPVSASENGWQITYYALDAAWVVDDGTDGPDRQFKLSRGLSVPPYWDGTPVPAYKVRYQVDNTPSFNKAGDTVYITMANMKDKTKGALVALKVDPTTGMLELKWAWPFKSPSGASPLVVENVNGLNGKTCIYFDGRYVYYPDYTKKAIAVAQIFAIVDDGDHASELWSYQVDPPTTGPSPNLGGVPLDKTIDASFASDPVHGCFWYYSTTWDEILNASGTDTSLRCLAFEGKAKEGEVEGGKREADVKMKVNPGCLFDDYCDMYWVSGVPSVTPGREPDSSVLVFNTFGTYGSYDIYKPLKRANKIVAVTLPKENSEKNMTIGELKWEYDLPPLSTPLLTGQPDPTELNNTSGQFAFFTPDPSVPPNSETKTRIIFSTNVNGVHVIGDDF